MLARSCCETIGKHWIKLLFFFFFIQIERYQFWKIEEANRAFFDYSKILLSVSIMYFIFVRFYLFFLFFFNFYKIAQNFYRTSDMNIFIRVITRIVRSLLLVYIYISLIFNAHFHNQNFYMENTWKKNVPFGK